MSNLLTKTSTKIKINGIDINYLKVGHGPNALLLTPGALGHISNFSLLIPLLDEKKYTTVVWEPPGYGFSRPPNRDFSPEHLHRDADYAIALMKMLQIDKYSLLGVCDGGTIALIVASKAINHVEKLVVWSCKAHITENDLELYETKRDIGQWPQIVRQENTEFYGVKYFAETWSAWVDTARTIVKENAGDICREALSKIAASTLIMHGAQDVLVPVEHAFYLNENIKDSELEIFPDGKHVLHIMFPERFHARLDKFLNNGQ